MEKLQQSCHRLGDMGDGKLSFHRAGKGSLGWQSTDVQGFGGFKDTCGNKMNCSDPLDFISTENRSRENATQAK